jgi:hypothetical protein
MSFYSIHISHSYAVNVQCFIFRFIFLSIVLLLSVQSRVYNGNLDDCGIVHITVGVGGNREGLAQK